MRKVRHLRAMLWPIDAAHEDGESRVFGAAHMHDAGQRNAAFDDQFVHELSLYVGPEKPGVAGWMEDAPREGGTLARWSAS